MLMLMFVGFAYSGPIPLLLPLSFIGLLTKYWIHKVQLIRFSKIPRPYDESLNNVLLRVMPFAFKSHFVTSILVYGSPHLFAYEASSVYDNVLL